MSTGKLGTVLPGCVHGNSVLINSDVKTLTRIIHSPELSLTFLPLSAHVSPHWFPLFEILYKNKYTHFFLPSSQKNCPRGKGKGNSEHTGCLIVRTDFGIVLFFPHSHANGRIAQDDKMRTCLAFSEVPIVCLQTPVAMDHSMVHCFNPKHW